MRVLSKEEEDQFSKILSLAGGDIDIVHRALKLEEISAKREKRDMEIKNVINNILDEVEGVNQKHSAVG